MDRTTCKPPSTGRLVHCDKKTTTFKIGEETYILYINNNGGIPCTTEPYKDCWTCWPRACHSCLDLYNMGERWGPNICTKCSEPGQRDDASPAGTPRGGQATVDYADAGAGSATQPRNAGVSVTTTDNESESIYLGNMDSPDSNQQDSAYSRSSNGTSDPGPSMAEPNRDFDIFMAEIYRPATPSIQPILSSLGMGGLADAEEIISDLELIEDLLPMDNEPMELGEGNDQHGETDEIQEVPVEEMGRDASRGEKQKPKRAPASPPTLGTINKRQSFLAAKPTRYQDQSPILMDPEDGATPRSASAASAYVRDDDTRGADAAGLARELRKKKLMRPTQQDGASGNTNKRGNSPQRMPKRTTPRMQVPGRRQMRTTPDHLTKEQLTERGYTWQQIKFYNIRQQQRAEFEKREERKKLRAEEKDAQDKIRRLRKELGNLYMESEPKENKRDELGMAASPPRERSTERQYGRSSRGESTHSSTHSRDDTQRRKRKHKKRHDGH